MSEPQAEAITSCRICAGQCGMRLSMDGTGRVLGARGDKSNPLTQGYACIKGLHLHEAHNSPERLLHPLKRCADGSFQRIDLEQALDEIAAQLAVLIERHGADTVAGFRGTMSYTNITAAHMLPDWLRSLGSSSFFSTMTVDQSAKWIAFERLGGWAGGSDSFDLAEVLLLVGTNPLVSLSTFNFPLQHPVRRLHDFKARGGKLIVIDPRLTETARHADVFLQPFPGQDAALIAGLLNLILANGWHDAEFCERHVAGLDRLRAAVAPFTAVEVARRAGVSASDLEAAARLFAHDCRRGSAASGTGPDMAPHSNLSEHLLGCLNVVCGRYARAGDPVANPGVIGPRHPRMAQVIPPQRNWEKGPRSRVGGLGMIFGEKMSAALPEEITTPGPGQIRALFVDGGNPVDAIPDQASTAAAMRQLELLVCIEPFMTNTARLAHYVIPPRLMFERHDLTTRDYETIVISRPYAQYAEPVATPPPGAEVVDDWVVFWALAKRLGISLIFDGVPLDMNRTPSTEELIQVLTRHSVVPFAELRGATEGRIFDVEPLHVLPQHPDSDARFDTMPADVEQELTKVLSEVSVAHGYTHRLAVRRMREVSNTMYHHTPGIRRRAPHNPACVHPQDLADLGLQSGELVEIRSAHGCVTAVVEADPSMRRGVLSLTHGWGAPPGDDDSAAGSSANRLVHPRAGIESINAMPHMSAVQVNIRRAEVSS